MEISFDSEKELEEIIFNLIRAERGSVFFDHPVPLILRQFNLGPYGIADLIAIKLFPNKKIEIEVIELKKEVISVKDFGQLARYMAGVKHLLEEISKNMPVLKRFLVRVKGILCAPVTKDPEVLWMLEHVTNQDIHVFNLSFHEFGLDFDEIEPIARYSNPSFKYDGEEKWANLYRECIKKYRIYNAYALPDNGGKYVQL